MMQLALQKTSVAPITKSHTQSQSRTRRTHIAIRALGSDRDTHEVDRRSLLAAVASVALLSTSSASAHARAIEPCTDFKTAPNGLQYCDIKVGSGEPPVQKAFVKYVHSCNGDTHLLCIKPQCLLCTTLTNHCSLPLHRVHYEGRLESETASGVFDSSYERGRPFSFSLGTHQVITGWDLGIGGDASLGIPPMLPGGKRRLIIPPGLAYGDRGVGPIPPKSTLTFDVEYINRLGVK
jgi:peptidylprolyl isomerase